MKNWFVSQRGAYFFLLLGIGLMLLFVALERRFPRADQLETAGGRVTWSRAAQGGLYFTLGGEERQFVVFVKGDADQRLRLAIQDAEAYPIKVRFHPEQVSSPSFLPGRFYAVYGVSVGGKEVSSLAVVQGSYRRDNLVALAMGVLFAAYGGRRVWNFRNAAADASADRYRRPR